MAKALKKERGKPVRLEYPPPRHAVAVVEVAAKQYIVDNVPVAVRNLYEGHVDKQYDPSTARTHLVIKLKSPDAVHTAAARVSDSSNRDVLVAVGKQLGSKLTMLLKQQHRFVKSTYSPLTKKKESGTVKAKPKPKKRKKVCKICGPEDSAFPPWEGECDHTFKIKGWAG